ncbi:hypothetical protein JCM1840_004506 [Sporobolomyces johnsonii]
MRTTGQLVKMDMLATNPEVAKALTSNSATQHFRKLPPKQTAVAAVAASFLNLLASPDHPQASLLRSAFLPALTGSETRAREPAVVREQDDQLLAFFAKPPAIALIQGVISSEQVENAWKAGRQSPMMDLVFLGYPLHTELERAKGEDAKEEVANLSMMVITTLAYELAQWIFVKMNGYRSFDAFSETASLYTTTTNQSMSSIQSSGSRLGPHRNKDDVGTKAVVALLGADYELLTYAIGERQLVKRRYPTRRSPSLTPPIVYYLIGDTPAIADVTSMPATTSGLIPPFKDGDSMYAITSVLTPAGVCRLHGNCVIHSSDDGASSVGVEPAGRRPSQVSVTLGQESEDVQDPRYRGL